jgi:hypothetical protein
MEPVNQENTLVETPGNPAPNVGAGSELTEENLEANILAALDSPTDVSTGAVETPAATDVPGEPPAAPDTKVEEKPPAEAVDEATGERLRQDNANLRATLLKLHIDPDSDTAEGLRSGLITFDDVVGARTPAPAATAPQAPESTTPQIPLAQKITNLQTRLARKEKVTDESYKSDMNAAIEVVLAQAQEMQNISQTMERTDLNNLLQTTLNATKEVFSTDVESVVPEDVRAIGEELFVGATDVAVGALARTHGQAKAFSKEGYQHAAKNVATRYDTFVKGIVKATQAATIKAIKEANPSVNTATVVNPIAPGAGGGTLPPPANPNKFSIANLDANVNEFMEGTESRVT